MKHKAVFLDRDGTVIVDHGYLDNVEGVQLLPGAGPALRKLVEADFLLVIVSNQSGIGRGYFVGAMVEAQHRRLAELLQPFGVTFAAMLFCPHRPDEDCQCRKPSPGMLRQAARELDIDCSRSFMVGDKLSDVAAGLAVGCHSILIGDDMPPGASAVSAKDLDAAVDIILGANERRGCNPALHYDEVSE